MSKILKDTLNALEIFEPLKREVPERVMSPPWEGEGC